MQETYLAHHGILGMKWGIRRYRNSDGTLTEAGKRRYSTPHEDSVRAHSKSASEMSDEELNRSIARVQKEQQYDRMVASTRDRGKEEIRKILTDNGEKAVGIIVSSAVTALAVKYIKNKINPPKK